jgi:iron uptake system EfeUOB component EfeO/EfeM
MHLSLAHGFFGIGARMGFKRRLISRAILGVLLFEAGMSQSHAEAFDEAVERYRINIREDIDQALAGARRLRDCLEANDLESAKKAWISARGGWERSEVFTSGLVPELDEKIDTWPKSTTGFHAIEAKLFGTKRTDAVNEADGLIADLAELDTKLRVMPLPPQDLLNGLARLAYEIGESKTDGGESRLSGTSLTDMQNNIIGIKQAYDIIFAPALTASDPFLAMKTQNQIEALSLLLERPSLNLVDSVKLRDASEEFVVTLTSVAVKVNLQKPVLEDLSK